MYMYVCILILDSSKHCHVVLMWHMSVMSVHVHNASLH